MKNLMTSVTEGSNVFLRTNVAFALIFALPLASCSRVHTVTSRTIQSEEISEAPTIEKKSSGVIPYTPEFLETPQKPLKIVLKKNQTGSLFDAAASRNFLFEPGPKLMIGDFVEIKIKTLDENQAEKKQDEVKSQQTDELLSALQEKYPHLVPRGEHELHVMSSFVAKVAGIETNGDRILTFERSSQSSADLSRLTLHGTLPFQTCIAKDTYDVGDLFNIVFNEVASSEKFFRKSTRWEDEYSLRLSGFHESKSQYEKFLEEKRKNLVELQKKIGEKYESFSNEKKKYTEEREKILSEKSALETEVSALKEKIPPEPDVKESDKAAKTPIKGAPVNG